MHRILGQILRCSSLDSSADESKEVCNPFHFDLFAKSFGTALHANRPEVSVGFLAEASFSAQDPAVPDLHSAMVTQSASRAKNLSILMAKSVQIRIDKLGKFVIEVRSFSNDFYLARQ